MSYKSVVNGLNPVHFPYENGEDETGNADLTVVGAVRHQVDTPGEGIPDYYYFDGTDDHLWAADGSPFDQTGNHTVVWWHRFDSSNTNSDNYANYWAKGDDGYQARLSGTDETAIRYDVKGGGEDKNVNENITGYTTWTMMAAVFNGSTIALYEVDSGGATLLGSTSRSAAVANTDQKWSVGCQFDGGTARRFIEADIVPPILFDSALSTTDLESIYDAKDDTPGISVVNRDNGSVGTNTVSLTGPTSGNLLLAFARSNGANSSELDTPPSGFTHIAKGGPSSGNSNYIAFAYKVSDGTETSVTWPNLANGSRRVGCVELSKNKDEFNIQSVIDVVDSGASSLEIGDITPDYTDGYACAGWIWDSSLTDTRSAENTNIFQNHDYNGTQADKTLLRTTAFNTTLSWSTSTRGIAGMMVVVSDYTSGTDYDETETESLGLSDDHLATKESEWSFEHDFVIGT